MCDLGGSAAPNNEGNDVVEKYRENQKRRNTKRGRIKRKLAVVFGLVIGTLVVEFLVLGMTADKTTWETALGVSGALWIGLGALLGGGLADNAMVSGMNPAASPITARTLSNDRLNQRENEYGSMWTMMMVGAVLLLLCFFLAYVF